MREAYRGEGDKTQRIRADALPAPRTPSHPTSLTLSPIFWVPATAEGGRSFRDR